MFEVEVNVNLRKISHYPCHSEQTKDDAEIENTEFGEKINSDEFEKSRSVIGEAEVQRDNLETETTITSCCG
jgi:hypothetical protein